MKKVFAFFLISLFLSRPVNADMLLNVAAGAVGIKAFSLIPSPSWSMQRFQAKMGVLEGTIDIPVMQNTSTKRLFTILALKFLVGYGAYKAVKYLLKPKQQDNSKLE